MERKIGEVFECDGKKLKVEEAENFYSCKGCFFLGLRECKNFKTDIKGNCSYYSYENDDYSLFRKDKKNVIFVEVKED